MIIRLTPVEHALSRRVGMLRHDKNREWGSEISIRIKEKHQKHEMDGFGAELAVAKVLNVYPDLCVDHASTADMVYNGLTIDVKQTDRENGRLFLPYEKRKFCDWYCLVIGELPVFTIMGFATLRQLRREENIIDVGYGPTYALGRDKLISVKDFVKNAEE